MVNRRDDDPTDDFSSPACSMHQTDDVHLGYAGKDELANLLSELLEAERAGARITLENAGAADNSPIAGLSRTMQQDQAHCCAMLLGHIKTREVQASSKVGAFYDTAMAVADLGERAALLNRGLRWVARRLREMVPRVRDQRLHSDLAEMLRSHQANIALANDLVKSFGILRRR
jgi:hypothetical protein